ncbi:saccharopine dehydrogenase C-terminal domain-containing protein [Flavisolibacter ginsenosidimutans]|uniref:Saccharopine dehydrogenase n=1 Tax=Flavisolibacter ginsenosidimutans TaxID=661481 RepID=A0A5B8UF88_9BACT|nr:saccharopine dehydrogenase C-terminal domain-containing protein [Flavisolibacter ginsenosidimutans]QEC55102.1 saccharopine dehydrogenase [Flavisolibacter ginsenosidimutans]
MKQILLFGAGKSSTALVEYFLVNAIAENWQLILVDASLQNAQEKLGDSSHGTALSFDVRDDKKRRVLIAKADIVISLMPPVLHILIAKDCLAEKKNLLTASYVDEQVRALKNEIKNAGLLFLCEMGLDPGIDHMSAKKLIDFIHAEGGRISSFHSHCGGLVAPESDDNPWHYKISWNPRNVVMAGKSGAVFKMNGEIKEWPYEELFTDKRYVSIPNAEPFCWYPNRDSLPYILTYGLQEAETFVRTTLRHPDFIYGWKNLIELKLTGEERLYNTDGKNLMQFFKEHMDLNGFGEWLQQKLHEQFDSTKGLLAELVNLVKLEEEAAKKGVEPVEEFMMVDDKGDLQNIDIDYLKISAAATLADRMHDANLTLKQLFYLGLDDELTPINLGQCSAADVLQFALEKKLMLQPEDKDMVVMLHEINYMKDETAYKATSSFVLKGEDGKHTAMAQTVGLPLAIATKLILKNAIQLKGLHIPTQKEIYEPVLAELAKHGISFSEEIIRITS